MAVAANRRFEIAFGNGLTVNASLILVIDLGVAVAAGLRDVGFVGGARGIGVAQDVMRAVAALAVGRHQQPLFAQRKAVDRIDVVWVNAGQAVFARHAIVVVALSLIHI